MDVCTSSSLVLTNAGMRFCSQGDLGKKESVLAYIFKGLRVHPGKAGLVAGTES